MSHDTQDQNSGRFAISGSSSFVCFLSNDSWYRSLMRFSRNSSAFY